MPGDNHQGDASGCNAPPTWNIDHAYDVVSNESADLGVFCDVFEFEHIVVGPAVRTSARQCLECQLDAFVDTHAHG